MRTVQRLYPLDFLLQEILNMLKKMDVKVSLHQSKVIFQRSSKPYLQTVEVQERVKTLFPNIYLLASSQAKDTKVVHNEQSGVSILGLRR